MELLTGPVLLIANPGARRARALRARALRAFAAAGVECVVVDTVAPGHGGEVAARDARGYRAVFTLGGDGTATEIIHALAGSGIPVGVLPGGTGNLVARSLGVPLDVARAVPALLGGEVAEVDLGVLNGGQRFVFTLGIGVDARMIELTPPALKRKWGILGYSLVVAREILARRTFRVRVEMDGETVEAEAASVMVANFGVVLGDLIHLGPDIATDDGMLDLCIFSPRGALDALSLVWRLFREDFRPRRGLLYRKGERFRISCEPAQTVQTDGEVRGRTPVEVRVEPRAARLLRPRDTARTRATPGHLAARRAGRELERHA